MPDFNLRLEQSQPASAPLIMTQQLYGTTEGHARPSTSRKNRRLSGYKHDPEARKRAKLRRETFKKLATDSRGKKPETFEEAVEFARTKSVDIGARSTLSSVLYVLKTAGYKWSSVRV